MQYWFDGHILSEESKRYIQNFLVVTRVRPDDEDVGHSDDMLSDEELIVDNSSFAEAISTRVGSKKKPTDCRCEQHADDGETFLVQADQETPDDNTVDAFQKAETYWPIPKTPTNPTRPTGDEMSDEIFVKTEQAVTASQKQTESTRQHVQDSREGSFRVGREYTTDDVHHFIEETHKRKKKGRPAVFQACSTAGAYQSRRAGL